MEVKCRCSLTSAVGEAVESRGALCALSTDNMLPAETLTSDWITSGSRGAGLIAVARQSSIVKRRCERASRVSAELGGGPGADGTEKYEQFSTIAEVLYVIITRGHRLQNPPSVRKLLFLYYHHENN